VPTFLHYPPEYKGDALSEDFAVELYDLIETSNATAWIYGHHHRNIPPYTIGNTRMLTNQLGYVRLREDKGFDPGAQLMLTNAA
jgi:predicted phosphohydrolase